MKSRYDIAVIGGGVTGCSVARALSRFVLDIVLLEKGPDVASGSSRANSAVVHAGYANRPGSLKAELCVRGNRMFDSFAGELCVPFRRTGKLVVANGEDDLRELEKLMQQGETNSVPGLKMICRDEIRELEPHIRAEHAMYSATSGITDPFLLTVALAENAAKNGVDFFFDAGVTDIEMDESDGGFTVKTARGPMKCDRIVNCAGLHSDRIAHMAGDPRYRIYPCRGEYFVLDRAHSHLISRMVYPVPPREQGVLGVHLTPTIEGNILIGPTAEFIEHREDLATTRAMMDILLSEARELLPDLPAGAVIRSFSGIRSKNVDEKSGGLGDFMIEESRHVPGLINLTGIESPGLTSAPSIPPIVVDILGESGKLVEKDDYDPRGRPVRRFSDMSTGGKAHMAGRHPGHRQVICRCEHVTRQEVLESLDGPTGARTIHGIKMRTRATTGRCQGGFCLPRIVEIMEGKGMDITAITLKGGKSRLFQGRVRDDD